MTSAVVSSGSTRTLTSSFTAPTLNQRFEVLPRDLLKSNENWATFWKVARVVNVIASTAIIAAAAATVLLWRPDMLLHFSVGSVVTIPYLFSVNNFIEEKIETCKQNVNKYQRIAKIYDQLIKKDGDALRKSFRKCGIRRGDIHNFLRIQGGFKKLIPGLAHLKYTNQMSVALNKEMENCRKLASKQKNPIQKRNYALKAATYDQSSYLSRIHAAYDLALLKNPFLKKTLADLGSIQEREPQNMLIDRLYANSQEVFYFNDPKKKPITFKDLASSLISLLKNPAREEDDALDSICNKLLTAS